jgi:Divergent InlB B-repeat domain
MGRQARRFLTAICVLAVALSVAAGSAVSGTESALLAPNARLDQSNPSRTRTCRAAGWVPDSANEWVAETFTAGVSGSLTDVTLWVAVNTPQSQVAITPVDASGRPVVATPLATSTLGGSATTAIGELGVAFPTPARVEAGKQYALVLFAPVREAWAWGADFGSAFAAQIGTPCAVGANTGGRMWLSSIDTGADADFFFQTYVVPAGHINITKTGTGTGRVQDATSALDCGSTCSGEFLQGQTVTLTATPDPGSTFSGWSGGGCAGTTPTCSVSVSGDLSVTATFTRKLVTLKVAKVGRGVVTSLQPGINCGRACSRAFVPGPLTLTAKPSKGWRFARWQGACRGIRPSCRLALTQPSSVTAIFTKR